MNALRGAGSRLGGMVAVLFVVSAVTFAVFVVIPGGDPAVRMAGRNASPQNIANIRHDWGFDRPYWDQYATMLKRVFITRSLVSYSDQTNVVTQIRRGLPATISLTVGASLLWLIAGVAMGTISALSAGRLPDRVLTILAVACVSLPAFWLGVVCRYLFAERHAWLPDGGYVGLTQDPIQWARHLLLPWTVLAAVYIGVYARVLRGSVLEVLNEDYVRVARAKGLSTWPVVARHVLRNAMVPIVSLFGLDVASVIGGGAVLVESVFDLQGIGAYAAQSVTNLDLPPIMGVTLYGAFFIVVATFVVDALYPIVDPRIRR